ncbi:MAG TPA: DUF3572 domain-containing protein [Magnetospirillum sp.]|jgi:hypothetical protein|nr:DUF3572 domain-containing protein [Magnetospirillum sp.]
MAVMDPFKPYQPKPRPAVPPRFSAEDAQVVALRALGFIAGDDALLSRFVALTGCGLDEVKVRVGDSAFLGAVLDFLLADEHSLLAFAESAGLAPEAPMLARQKLA